MLITQFPNLQWLQKQAKSAFANRKSPLGNLPPQEGWPNVILNTSTTKAYRPDILGPLSLFSNLSGESRCKVNGRTTTIPGGTFFLTNPGKHYTLEVESTKKVETFNIHFGKNFTEKGIASLRSSHHQLLAQEPSQHSTEISFSEQLYTQSSAFQRIVAALRISSQEKSLTNLEEEGHLFAMLELIVGEQERIEQGLDRLSATKTATRKEIYRRLSRSKDCIHGSFRNRLDLDDLAKAGGLSKYHFLRCFRSVFGVTPHQYLIQLRLEEACQQLKSTRLPVIDIALSCGFDHPESFHRAFRKRMAISPLAYRNAH